MPEHCAPTSWRPGSSFRADMMSRIVATISPCLDPAADSDGVCGIKSAKVDCACTTTPFIEVTVWLPDSKGYAPRRL